MPDAEEFFDVCVIGSGAGGAPAAAELARRGLKVALLERGPLYADKDLKKDELTVCRMPMFRPDEARGRREIHYGDAPPVVANHFWTAACVGGGTRIMSGFFFRMHEEDFKPRTLFGPVENATHQDWPLTLAELVPYYDRVESDIGISGSPLCRNATGAPLAPLTAHPVSGLIDAACARCGIKTVPTPRAILSEEWKKRGPCSYSGLCGSYACLTGAKASMHENYIKHALESGNCTLLPDRFVFLLETHNGSVRRAHFFDRANMPRAIGARVFIIACGAIETARLLLNSRNGDHSRGLANGSGQVGKHLTFTMPCEVTGFFDTTLFPAPGAAESPFVQRSTPDLRAIDGDGLTYKRGGTIVFLFPHPNPIQRIMMLSYTGGRRLFGKLLKDRAREYFSYHHLSSDTFIDFLPNPRTFVTLSHASRDYWGIPSARIHVAAHEQSVRAARIVAERITEIFSVMGADGVDYNQSPFTGGELQHGTCRFGDDPKQSVLDPFCRSHEIKNLYITDASFMPSGIPVPSTFTIMANSLRVADYIYKNG